MPPRLRPRPLARAGARRGGDVDAELPHEAQENPCPTYFFLARFAVSGPVDVMEVNRILSPSTTVVLV